MKKVFKSCQQNNKYKVSSLNTITPKLCKDILMATKMHLRRVYCVCKVRLSMKILVQVHLAEFRLAEFQIAETVLLLLLLTQILTLGDLGFGELKFSEMRHRTLSAAMWSYLQTIVLTCHIFCTCVN